MSGSLRPHGLQPIRILRPWDFPGKSTGVGFHFLLQGIFLTQGSNLGLPHFRQTRYHLSHQEAHDYTVEIEIPYNYTVEVRNRFKRLDLIDRVSDELWTEVMTLYRRQGSTPSPWKRNAKKQNGCLGRPCKKL